MVGGIPTPDHVPGHSCPFRKETPHQTPNPFLVPHGFRVYDGFYPHFVTSATIHWIPVFRRDDYYRVLVDNLNHCIEHKGLLVHGYVLMPDHFHLICTHTEGNLSRLLGSFKGYTAHQIIPMIRQDGRTLWIRAMEQSGESETSAKLWQGELHPEQVHTRPFFEQKLRYVHDNPIRAGFVSSPCHWKYSSAGFYYQDAPSPIRIALLDW